MSLVLLPPTSRAGVVPESEFFTWCAESRITHRVETFVYGSPHGSQLRCPMHCLKAMSLDGASLCCPAALTAPQCVQGVKDISLVEPQLFPPARTPERPGSAQLHVCQCQWQGMMGEWKNGRRFTRSGVCLLSSKCGAADTMDLSSFIPPLICVPAPHCGRLIIDRKG